MAIGGVVEALKEDIFSALIDTTRTAGRISNEDLAFHRSSNASIDALLDRQNSRLLQLVQSLTRSATVGTGICIPQLADTDSIEDAWKSLVDVLDSTLEKADACLDEYTGTVRRLSSTQEERLQIAATSRDRNKPFRAYRTQHVAKPQLLFENVPKNDELAPFKPLLCSKPNAITPLEETLVQLTSGFEGYNHPYETEIIKSQYPATVYAKTDPIPYTSYQTTTAAFVDTPEALMSMLEELKHASEIAVDLEHHEEHSYIGLVSLMQISTRDNDFVIDTLKPWRQKLQILNEVFTDPNVLKVFHGAYMDMIWLQRDFGLYVVGLFDTFHASRCLGYPRNSLAYLLKRFADFDAAKQYQMADWRIRPLPEEMFNYARSDTHFLLYVYDNMRNELIDNSDFSLEDGNLINVVINNSKEESLQRYERPQYDSHRGTGAMGWYNLLCRTPALFTREQFAVFRAVHQWRDTVARVEDESVSTIMPKQTLYNIAREMPKDIPSLLGCSHPMSKFFQERREDVLQLIQKSRSEGATGPELKDLIGNISSAGAKDKQILDRRQIETTGPECADHGLTLLGPLKKNETSLFWGEIVSNRPMFSRDGLHSFDEALHLVLPFPQLTAKAYRDVKVAGRVDPAIPVTDNKADIDHQDIPEGNADRDVFILKQGGPSRKRGNSQLQTKDESKPSVRVRHGFNCDSMSQDLHVEQCEKERLRKKGRSLLGLNAHAQAVEEPKVFDYAKAPSVLHPKRGDREVSGREGRLIERPYLKSMDTPKGLRKMKTESGGNKSLTYRG